MVGNRHGTRAHQDKTDRSEGRKHRDKDRRPPQDDRRPDDRPDPNSPWSEERILELYRRLQRIAREKNRSTYTPWLLIRYALTDVGARPIPNGEIHWKSPDIRVESSDPDGNAVAGEANFVHCRVFNLGLAAALPVQVDFYWADPSLGLDAHHMKPIGTEWVTIPSWQSREVRCQTPWVPEFVNNGHECLKVNCSNWILDPIQNPFKPRLDRRAGQRNITVLSAPAGKAAKMLLFANNLFPIETAVAVTARMRVLRPTRVGLALPRKTLLNQLASTTHSGANDGWEIEQRFAAGALPARTREALAALGRHAHTQFRQKDPIATPVRGTPALAAGLTDHTRILVPQHTGKAMCDAFGADDKLSSDGACTQGGSDIPILRFTAQPFEQRQLEVEVTAPGEAASGDVVVADILLRTDRHIIGGYTLVVSVT
ncbi:hypothetical protein [Fodinicurvata sp. EGI_FJ10296]|uniref:hypothetical protein n=1 Tax=Fodinicurvata sp. EGI_FJ10296 TaxID=3231908 RepID=UPI003453429C